jgi:hypothetical protein
VSDNPKITLAERLDHGLVTLLEVAELGHFSLRKVQKDAANGLLVVEKHGRSVRAQGPNAKAYLAGQPAPANAA